MNDPNSPCAKRRRADAPQVVNNTTIHNYFAPASGPAAIPEDTRPPNLFPEGERNHSIYQPHKVHSYRVSHATCDGQLKAGCANCTSNYKDMVQFAPLECNHNGRKRPQFLEALQAYSVAYEARDLEAARAARAKVEELRNAYCPSCQESTGKLSPAVQACKDEHERMRKAACNKNNGCANPDCRERGIQAWCVLQGDLEGHLQRSIRQTLTEHLTKRPPTPLASAASGRTPRSNPLLPPRWPSPPPSCAPATRR
jgi:hypothetical protein